jgi:hypothetical protein
MKYQVLVWTVTSLLPLMGVPSISPSVVTPDKRVKTASAFFAQAELDRKLKR